MTSARVRRIAKEDILEHLDLLEARRPELSEAIAFYRGALPVLRVAGTAVIPFEYNLKAAQGKIAAGVPLLIGEELPFDAPTLLALFGILCQVAEAVDGAGENPAARQPITTGAEEPQRAAADIRQVAERGELNLLDIVGVVPAGDIEQIALVADRYDLDEGLLVLLVQNTVRPSLQAWAESLAEQVDYSGWGQGMCPVCGCRPAICEIEEKTGTRYLQCFMCSTRWPYPEAQCIYCRNDEPGMRRLFSTAGEDRQFWIEGCRSCGGYVKRVLTTGPLAAERLVADELATLHLDVLALEEGYVSNPEI